MAGERADFQIINDGIKNNLIFYKPVNIMGTITSSHDQVRFISFADGQIGFEENAIERAFHDPPINVLNKSSYDKLFMFNVMNMCLPGIPVIYYGEEIGMLGAGDPDNRRPMRFQNELAAEEKEFLNKMRKLIKLRSKHPTLSLVIGIQFIN